MFHYFKIPYFTCTFFTKFIYNEYIGPYIRPCSSARHPSGRTSGRGDGCPRANGPPRGRSACGVGPWRFSPVRSREGGRSSRAASDRRLGERARGGVSAPVVVWSAACGTAEPALVLHELDAVVTRHGLESLQIPAADRAEDGVVGEAGALGDLARGKDIAGGLHHWRGSLSMRLGSGGGVGDDPVE